METSLRIEESSDWNIVTDDDLKSIEDVVEIKRIKEMPSEQRDEHFLHLKRTITTRNLEMPKKKCIIYEDNKFGQWWQMYQTVMIIYVCIVIPYRMGTDAKDNKAWIIVNAIVDISFGIDMVLTFMTSYNNASTGKLVDDHKQIAKNYILSWFFIDLVSIFPIELIINAVRQSQT